jgi:hypothetical protein
MVGGDRELTAESGLQNCSKLHCDSNNINNNNSNNNNNNNKITKAQTYTGSRHVHHHEHSTINLSVLANTLMHM